MDRSALELLDVDDGGVDEPVRQVRQGAGNRELFADAGSGRVAGMTSRSTEPDRFGFVDAKPCLCFGLVGVLADRDLQGPDLVLVDDLEHFGLLVWGAF